MKTRVLLIQLIFVFFLMSCNKEPNIPVNDGITLQYFDKKINTTSILVDYNEIIGYDSLKYTFVLDRLAWNRLKNKVAETEFYLAPFPDFIIDISLNDNLIYRAGYVPSFSSSINDLDKVLFDIKEPNLICLKIDFLDKRKDFRNDLRLIECLKKDKKLITLN